MNLEMKVPRDLSVKNKYRWKEAVKQLHSLIQKMNMVEFCMVQNFDHEALRAFEYENKKYIDTIEDELKEERILPTIYLHNYMWYDKKSPIT